MEALRDSTEGHEGPKEGHQGPEGPVKDTMSPKVQGGDTRPHTSPKVRETRAQRPAINMSMRKHKRRSLMEINFHKFSPLRLEPLTSWTGKAAPFAIRPRCLLKLKYG